MKIDGRKCIANPIVNREGVAKTGDFYRSTIAAMPDHEPREQQDIATKMTELAYLVNMVECLDDLQAAAQRKDKNA